MRCGTIAIVGRANAGKSTLMNHLIGQKISITSRKAQTTRHRLLGILTRHDAQFLFLDTPGMQTQHKSALHRAMSRSVSGALEEADVILWVMDGLTLDLTEEKLRKVLPPNSTVVAAINKVDRLSNKGELLPHLERLAGWHPFAAMVPVSAKHGIGVDDLLLTLKAHLPEGAAIYPADDITDRNERFLAAEIIREKLMRSLGEEIPYSTHVSIIKFELEGTMRRIEAEIVVARPGHKAVVIGKGGEKLKAMGTAARQLAQAHFDSRLIVDLQMEMYSRLMRRRIERSVR